MKAFDRVVTTFGILLVLSFRADAHDPSMAHHEWFNAQEMNPAARARLGVPWKSCCDNGDVFKTRFRVGDDRSDQWQYLKDGEWKTIPPDIIKEGDTPDHTPCCSSTNTREWSFASLYRKEVSDDLANNGRIYARTIGAGPQDIWINPMPMFHTAGCGLCTLGALQTGGAQVLPPGYDPELMLSLFEQERGTIMLCVPTMLIRMFDSPSIA